MSRQYKCLVRVLNRFVAQQLNVCILLVDAFIALMLMLILNVNAQPRLDGPAMTAYGPMNKTS